MDNEYMTRADYIEIIEKLDKEIEQLKSENKRVNEENNLLREQLAEEHNSAIENLVNENTSLKARLEKSVELPCKVGDTVYFIRNTFSNAIHPITATVTGIISIYADNTVLYRAETINGNKRAFDSKEINEKIFLTLAEAEKALKEMEMK
jgi:seryl-tRNA synthetase